MEFRSKQKVYFDDLDALNILHNVRYLVFIERARGELLQSLGFSWSDDNPDKWHVVAAHEIRYLRPVTGDHELAILLRVEKLGTTSLTLGAKVTSVSGDIVYATSSTRLVHLDSVTKQPAPWSDGFRQAISIYV